MKVLKLNDSYLMGIMKKSYHIVICWVLLASFLLAANGGNKVEIVNDSRGFKMKIDGKDTMIKGVEWGYTPRGENYSYSLWNQSDDFIKAVLDYEMPMIKKFGFNAIRSFGHIPPQWVEYIYQKWSIYYMPNHFVGRYGETINGSWITPIDYSDETQRKALVKLVTDYMREYRDVPGVIGYLLGNENNYGLEWTSFEIEEIPEGERHKAKAKYLYSLFEEVAKAVKEMDPTRPVGIANGDLQYIDLIVEECKSIDFLGANVYRGLSSGSLFDEVKEKLNLPFIYTEFGCDAFNARTKREDDAPQAYYLSEQWREIYQHSYGKGRSGVAIGGFVFGWTDGWWKYLQTENLDIQDEVASWGATWGGGYEFDHVPGQNNMNEEWWGITAFGELDSKGVTLKIPRSACYALQDVFAFDVYRAGSISEINTYFDRELKWAKTAVERPNYAVQSMRAKLKENNKFRVDEVSFYSEGIVASDSLNSNQGKDGNDVDTYQNLFLQFAFDPLPGLSGFVSLNIRGNIPDSSVKLHRPLFYGRSAENLEIRDGQTLGLQTIEGLNQVELYRASIKYNNPLFDMHFFYREGHFHWRYEGDLFNLYQETYNYEEYDQYEQVTPYGFLFTGHKPIEGLKIALGPEVALGSAPGIIAKYQIPWYYLPSWMGWTFIYQEDVAGLGIGDRSRPAKPGITGRRGSAVGQVKVGAFDFQYGMLWAGSSQVGRTFVKVNEADDPNGGHLNSGYNVFEDEIEWVDTFGSKANLTYSGGRVLAYAEAAYHGLVADSRGEQISLRPGGDGWMLKDEGGGNKIYGLLGAVWNVTSHWSISPNAIYRTPLVPANPDLGPATNDTDGNVFPTVKPRNYSDDPFAVLGSRELYGGELLVLYDPTPENWFYQWDNALQESSRFLWHLRFVYRNYPTASDADTFFTGSGGTWAPFAAGLPAAQTYYGDTKMIFNLADNKLKMILHGYGGYEQPRGNDGATTVTNFTGTEARGPSGEREVLRYGGSLRLLYAGLDFNSFFKINDWGHYDYHRQFNWTYPFQMLLDVGWNFRHAKPLKEQFKVGSYFEWRSLDQYSFTRGEEVVFSSPDFPDYEGYEWALGVYIKMNLL